ncbi:hypothetical protein GDO81_009498 [Engystomops pustulosus]|uniref:Uncharacterized protein n=1 Tax=Engystomops pustulosus TaxID=76066 RepID=A0AAV7BSH2_ENGPU|nr:hypothetical protein GDO81_009498 [Engystomops pustulosus]
MTSAGQEISLQNLPVKYNLHTPDHPLYRRQKTFQSPLYSTKAEWKYQNKNYPAILHQESKMIRNSFMRWKLPIICFTWQIAMIILFGVFVRYEIQADPHWTETRIAFNISSNIENDFYYRYPNLSCTSMTQRGRFTYPVHSRSSGAFSAEDSGPAGIH